jgi:hypothetical protein
MSSSYYAVQEAAAAAAAASGTLNTPTAASTTATWNQLEYMHHQSQHQINQHHYPSYHPYLAAASQFVPNLPGLQPHQQPQHAAPIFKSDVAGSGRPNSAVQTENYEEQQQPPSSASSRSPQPPTTTAAAASINSLYSHPQHPVSDHVTDFARRMGFSAAGGGGNEAEAAALQAATFAASYDVYGQHKSASTSPSSFYPWMKNYTGKKKRHIS